MEIIGLLIEPQRRCRETQDIERGLAKLANLPGVRFKRSIPQIEFEWDEAKHAKTLRDRGIGFDDGARIFAGPVRIPAVRTARIAFGR